MATVTDITTRRALDRLYDKAQRIGKLEAHMDVLREIHSRLSDGRDDLGEFADWVSVKVRAYLDDAARGHQ